MTFAWPGAKKPFRRENAFTLLEMAITLFIIVLVLGMGAGLMRGVIGNEGLREADRQARFLAKTARLSAMRESREYELVLEPGALVVRPARPTEEDGAAEEEASGTTRYAIAGGIRALARHWGSEEWLEEAAFRFPASGLCEPASFRFERNEAWMEFTLNPLTANPQDEGFYLP